MYYLKSSYKDEKVGNWSYRDFSYPGFSVVLIGVKSVSRIVTYGTGFLSR